MARIEIDYAKCHGCRACEMACSLRHVKNTYDPKRSRIRVFQAGDKFIPVIAGPHTDTECVSKGAYVIDGTPVSSCVLCRAACPSRPTFRVPETGQPLRCDFCGKKPDPECCKVCLTGALRFVED